MTVLIMSDSSIVENELTSLLSIEKIDYVCGNALDKMFKENTINLVIVMDNNFNSMESLLELMHGNDCHSLVFLSTSKIYSQSNKPIKEDDSKNLKSIVGQLILDNENLIRRQTWLNSIILRIFEITQTSILPELVEAYKSDKEFHVYGNSYYENRRADENDHTIVRDYIDIRDVALSILKSANKLLDEQDKRNEHQIFNIGSGKDYSILEVIETFEIVNNCKLKKDIHSLRKGQFPYIVANISKAMELLNWRPKYTLEESLKI